MKASLLFAGMMLAGMTFAASAAKPELTGQEKKDLAAKAAAQAKKSPPQPKTMAQSNAAQLRTGKVARGQLVATDLWNTLSVQTDANGKQRIVESNGLVDEAPKAEGLPNE